MTSLTLAPTADTFITSDAPATNYDTNNFLGLGDHNAAATQWRPIIKFNTASVPGAIISASLQLYLNTDLSDNTRTARVYRVKQAYVSGQATWNIYSTGNNWQTAGASGANDREATDIGNLSIANNQAVGTYVTITLTASAIDAMRTGAFTDNGLLVQMDTESNDGWLIDSLETAGNNYPLLVVEYTLGGNIMWWY